jgi:uncharacterized protein (DUF2235 family)
MKRLVIFCDGTWNALSSQYHTNVVMAAQAVLPQSDGIAQIVYYNEGVGTTYLVSRKWEQRLAGAFGLGLFDKIADAYRFIVFNYEPGDEIYIFGFSRGAFTARSLAGLIRKAGIISKATVGRIADAFAFYKEPETRPDDEPAQEFRADNSYHTLMKEKDRDWRRNWAPHPSLQDMPLFTIKYVGVWDTVGALGVPKHLLFEAIFRTARRFQFHDTELSSVVESARHAVAIDETRRSFEPALWKNLPDLRKLEGRSENYAQLWFPGDHGSVGGGGAIRGLSSGAMLWILEGAQRMGLAFDEAWLEQIRAQVDPYSPLRNVDAPPDFLDRHVYQRAPRSGVESVDDISDIALARIAHRTKSHDSAWVPYRPEPLRGISKDIPDWD